jgi:hypothetical protein
MTTKSVSIRKFHSGYEPTFKGYWPMVTIFRFDLVLKATQMSSLGQKGLL